MPALTHVSTPRKLLVQCLKGHWQKLSLGVVLLCGHQAAEAAVPVAIGLIIDQAVATGDIPSLIIGITAMAVLFVALSMAWRFGSRLTIIATEFQAHQLRVDIADRVLDPHGQTTGMRSGELLSVATSDADRTSQIFMAASRGFASLIAIVAAAVALITIDAPLGLAVLIAAPALAIALQLLAPLLTRRNAAQQESLAHTTALATDLVAGLRVIHGINAQQQAAALYRRTSNRTLKLTIRAATMNGVYQGLNAAATGILLAAVAAVAGWFTLNGRISIGDLVAIVGLTQFIAEPTQMLGMCGQMLARARASAARVARVLGSKPLISVGAEQLTTASSGVGIAFNDVTYRSLQQISFAAEPGATIGIVGYEPKDTDALVSLLSGEVPREDYAGSVKLNDMRVEKIDIDAYRRAVLVEPHQTVLFEETVQSNLQAARNTAPAPDLDASLRAAAANEVVDSLENGLDHMVTERGMTLSGGQRQRLGLARAIAAGPDVLVLHDPTTALDSATEALVAEGLTEIRGHSGGTTLVITHSPALLSKMEHVVIISDGQVTASGSHENLLANDSDYRAAILR